MPRKKPTQTRFGKTDVPLRRQTRYGDLGFCETVFVMVREEASAKGEYERLYTKCIVDVEKGFIPRGSCGKIKRIAGQEQKHHDTLRQIHLNYCRGRDT